MDPHFMAQDVLRCHVCETPVPPMHCDTCHVHLCVVCVGEHLLDESKEHKVVPFKRRGSTINYPKCPKHSTKQCELHCENCNKPICAQCVSSKKHKRHKIVDIVKVLESKKSILHKDLIELTKIIYPEYQKLTSKVLGLKADLKKKTKKLTAVIDKHGEDLHKEIDIAIKKLQTDVDEIALKNMILLNEKEDEIKCSVSKISQSIDILEKLLNSSDVTFASDYKSRNAEFRRLPPKITVSLPRFIPQKINKEQISRLLGSLSTESIQAEECYYHMGSPDAVFSLLDRPLIDEPKTITEINTDYGESNILCSVSCLSDEQVWTSGKDNILRLYNLQGKLEQSVQTKSGNEAEGITVTQSGELVYTDSYDKTVNIVKDTQIKTVIRLRNWVPGFICSSCTSGDLLVVMVSDDEKQAKVVRYFGSTEKQTIQYDAKGQALYSPDPYPKYICENKNLDICVADYYNNAVVVVNQAGKLRFTYTGLPSTPKLPFEPVGITTDSHSRILTADWNNDCIHILDQDGQFLCYIYKCDLHHPFGLCVDTRDNLFVAELYTGKVRKIQYSP